MILRHVPGASRVLLIVTLLCLGQAARAAPYADMVMDARSGEVLHASNADSRLHPASLTKMMTLYVAFEAIRLGEISLDTMVTISPKAASEPPSRLGLRAGQRIQMRFLIRAAAVKSANDAATAIGEAISGSEAAFARRMNRTARALGMARTTFKNAHGLTESGHLSTARDMTILGRHLFYDYPQYYNIFSRRSADAGVGEVANTNRRFLDAYEGADGIKTGFTNAAGFNLVASAQRGNVRIIATVFGGRSTPHRNALMAELMDLGFQRAPRRVAANRPNLPNYDGIPDDATAQLAAGGNEGAFGVNGGRITRASGAVQRSPIPRPRGGTGGEPPPEALLAAIETDVATAVASAAAAQAVAEAAQAVETAAAETAAAAVEAAVAEATEATLDATQAVAGPASAATELAEAAPAVLPATPPRPRPASLSAASQADDAGQMPAAEVPAAETVVADAPGAAPPEPGATGTAETQAAAILPAEPVPDAAEIAALAEAGLVPAADPGTGPEADLPAPAALQGALAQPPAVALAAAGRPAPDALAVLMAVPEPVLRPEPVAAEVVTRASTSGGRHVGISLGRFPSRFEAEKLLIATALADPGGLGGALRRIVQRGGGFEASFMGLTSDQAGLACRRLAARGRPCDPIGE